MKLSKYIFTTVLLMFCMIVTFQTCEAKEDMRGKVHFVGQIQGADQAVLEIDVVGEDESTRTITIDVNNGCAETTVDFGTGNYGIREVEFRGCEGSQYTVDPETFTVSENSTTEITFDITYDNDNELSSDFSYNGGVSGKEIAEQKEQEENTQIEKEKEQITATASPSQKTTSSGSYSGAKNWNKKLQFIGKLCGICLAVFIGIAFFGIAVWWLHNKNNENE